MDQSKYLVPKGSPLPLNSKCKLLRFLIFVTFRTKGQGLFRVVQLSFWLLFLLEETEEANFLQQGIATLQKSGPAQPMLGSVALTDT